MSGAVTVFFLMAGLGFKIFVGFDPDEQYAYSMMFRFVSGDAYLSDLSDAYMFSAYLMSPVYYLSAAVSKLGLGNPDRKSVV